jgi:hypothetical protein
VYFRLSKSDQTSPIISWPIYNFVQSFLNNST